MDTVSPPSARVLIVDDDEAVRDMLVTVLNERGYATTGVTDPSEAEDAVQLWGAQIVLCDICMPGIDGLEVTRRLKEKDGGTQVILMTGYPSEESVNSAFHLGADDYLLKPFHNIDVVYKAIDEAADRLSKWAETKRKIIERDFPEAADILFGTLSSDFGDVDALLQEVNGDIPEAPA